MAPRDIPQLSQLPYNTQNNTPARTISAPMFYTSSEANERKKNCQLGNTSTRSFHRDIVHRLHSPGFEKQLGVVLRGVWHLACDLVYGKARLLLILACLTPPHIWRPLSLSGGSTAV